jgi:hypothetical protein
MRKVFRKEQDLPTNVPVWFTVSPENLRLLKIGASNSNKEMLGIASLDYF